MNALSRFFVYEAGTITWTGPTDPQALSQVHDAFWTFWDAFAPTSAYYVDLPLAIQHIPPGVHAQVRQLKLWPATRQMTCTTTHPLAPPAQYVLDTLGCQWDPNPMAPAGRPTDPNAPPPPPELPTPQLPT
jgi:hypothetical protein